MFDIGWSEMAVIVVVALVVVGPKQLPEALRTVTQFTRKARRYAQEFRSGIDNIVREAELDEARQALNTVRSANPSKALQDLIDPTGEIDEEMRDLDRTAKASQASVTSAGADKPKTETAAPAASAEAGEGEGETPAAEGGARRVKEPLSIAPASSLRPPPGPDIFAATPPSPAPAPKAEESAAERPAPPAAEPAPAAKAEEDAAPAEPQAETEAETPAADQDRRQA